MTCTTCPYCGVGCGVKVEEDLSVSGDASHPANFGRLCSKGSALGATLDLDGRLLAPRVDGADTSWDIALRRVADAFQTAIAEHGPDAVAFYVSGQLLTEDYYVANKLMKGFIGSANIDTNSRLCMASSVAGHKRAFGTDTVPGTYEDLEEADLIVLVGSNLAWCHPVLYQRIAAAKAARPGMRVINIDPRQTATSDLADLHLAVAPDGDIALLNALLARIADGAIAEDFVADHVSGLDAAVQAAKASDPAGSGLTPEQIAEFCALWIGTRKVVTVYSQGVNQSACGTDKVNAIVNCHLATGRIGRPGMGPFSVTGQPNAMGGREVGGLANTLGWHLDIGNADHRAAVQAAWGGPGLCQTPGLRAVDLFQACADGKIKALWVMSTNPAASMPDADAVSAAIAKVPFTVVSDIMARTDTGDLADVLLPATGWGEKSGTVTNSERRISRQRRFLPVPGTARPDWRIICDVAAQMGWASAFDFQTEADVFREYARLSALSRDFGKDFDITGLAALSDADYDDLQPVQWPVPLSGAAGGRFFGSGGFTHEDGRARMLPITSPAVDKPAGLRLNTGRIRDQWHTMTRTGKAPQLGQHLAEPYVEMHPEDAFARGLRDADLVHLTSPQGNGVLRLLISSKVQRGQIFVPMHWTRQRAPASRANALVAPVVDPVSSQPALKGSLVEARKFDAAWYGFAVSDRAMVPDTDYAALARIDGGWQMEIAGTGARIQTPDMLEDWARALTGQTGGSAVVLQDPARGVQRIAITDGGTLRALVFAGPQPVGVARAFVAGLLGSDIAPQLALAGRPGADMPDPGATVCACFNVGVNTLKSAIASGSHTVDALGAATCAGTNCGSCKPELAALIAANGVAVAAE